VVTDPQTDTYTHTHTHTHTHKQTGAITIHCAAASLARSVDIIYRSTYNSNCMFYAITITIKEVYA